MSLVSIKCGGLDTSQAGLLYALTPCPGKATGKDEAKLQSGKKVAVQLMLRPDHDHTQAGRVQLAVSSDSDCAASMHVFASMKAMSCPVSACKESC